jgi:hypothetical protein
MITDISSEDRLVQKTFAEHLEKVFRREDACTYCYLSTGVSGEYCIS